MWIYINIITKNGARMITIRNDKSIHEFNDITGLRRPKYTDSFGNLFGEKTDDGKIFKTTGSWEYFRDGCHKII
jgi:hypothetical protein